MRTRFVLALLVLVGLTGITGCGSATTSTSSGGGTTSAPTTAAAGLAGTSWNLRSYQGPAGAVVPAAPGSTATLVFRDGGVLNGSTGCNQFGGTYVVTGGQLSVALGPMTQMACVSPVLQAQETAVVQLLPQVTGFRSADGTLTLTGTGDASLLTYGAGLAGLEGTSWKATGVNNGRGAVEGTALTDNLTAVFGTGGAFTGFGGCNDLSGSYTTSGGDGLTITGLAGTTKACAPDVGALEARYVAALGRVTTYEISGDTLTLRDSEGAMQATFRQAG